MTGIIEDSFLRFEGLDDADLAAINRILPDLENLVVVAKNHQAQFNRVVTVLLPIVEKIIAKQKELK